MNELRDPVSGRFENKHGMYKTRFYRIWLGMKARCDRKTCNGYDNYGGRGIGYCERWNIFQNFYEDMYSTYDDNLTLDRIDGDLDYSKKNCRWVTTKQQAVNKNTNVRVTIDGINLTLSEWRDLYDLTNSMVYKRHERGELGYSLIRPSGVRVVEGSTYGLTKPSQLIKEQQND